MAKNLTMTGAGYNSTGKFGSSLNAGYGESATTPLPAGGSWSVAAWVRQATNPGGLKVAVGQPSAFYFGCDAAGKAYAAFGGTSERTLSSTVSVVDAAWHYLELGTDGTNSYFFVDGALVNLQAGSLSAAGGVLTGIFGVREFAGVGGGGYDWPGEVDDVSVWSTCQHTASYTPPTAPTSSAAANLAALYSLNGSGADGASGATPATALVFNAAPTTGTVGAASTAFTVAANGAITGTVVVTPNDGGQGGTFTPATVSLSSSTPTADFTYTAPTAGAKTISLTNNGGLTNPTAVTYTASAVGGNNALTNGTGNVLFSPENWEIQASKAKSINAGAEFRLLFTGTSCTLQFDMTSAGAPLSQISYQVDGTGAWTTVPIAANVVISVPSSTSDYADKGGHLVHVVVKSTSETINRWAVASQTAVILAGVVLDAGKAISKPAGAALKGIIYGDSITEGVRTLNATASNDTDRNDARQSWAYIMGKLLGADVGVIGFGRHGFTVTGNPDVPIFGSSYNFLSSGVARPFSTALDFVAINMGTNDSTANTVAAATGILNGLLTATAAKIIVFRPFKDTSQAANLQAAIAACSAPSRCFYVDTAGWFNTVNSADALHPYGNENIIHIAPLAAAAVRSALASAAATTPRTITVSGLKIDAATLANGLTGVKVSFRDAAGPDLPGLLSYQSSAQTITGGVLSFTANTTLASGAVGWVDIKAPGIHYCGTVVVP